jgi:hypothetical protein
VDTADDLADDGGVVVAAIGQLRKRDLPDPRGPGANVMITIFAIFFSRGSVKLFPAIQGNDRNSRQQAVTEQVLGF